MAGRSWHLPFYLGCATDIGQRETIFTRRWDTNSHFSPQPTINQQPTRKITSRGELRTSKRSLQSKSWLLSFSLPWHPFCLAPSLCVPFSNNTHKHTQSNRYTDRSATKGQRSRSASRLTSTTTLPPKQQQQQQQQQQRRRPHIHDYRQHLQRHRVDPLG